MNTRAFYSGLIRSAIIASASVGVLMCVITASGVEKTNPPAKASPGATNAVAKPAPIEVPLSQFTIPSSTAEGRNPFFPDSTFGKVVVNPTNAGVKVTVALTLNGISKVGTKWFALINGRTFEAGEDGDVTIAPGRKAHVLCVSIKADGATVEVDGNRQDLKLKSGY